MCEPIAQRLIRLARSGADTEHALRKALRLVGDTGGLSTVRRELEERGDQGALEFLERLMATAEEGQPGEAQAAANRFRALSKPIGW